jgi:transcription antitermination factor NusG
MASTRATCPILAVLALCAAPAAFSQSLPPALIACAIEKKDKVRLECFDREVARVVQSAAADPAPAQSPSTPPAPAAAPATAAAAVPAAAASAAPAPAPAPASAATESAMDEFGLSGELARKRREEKRGGKATPTELRAGVSKVSRKPYGEYVIELDNGQVWEQPEKKSSFEIKAGDTVRITPGVMGSFFLVVDQGGSTKVRRIR